MKTKAIVFRAANQPSLEEIDLPELQPGDALVRTEFSGVSIGTESSIFSGMRTHNGTFPLVGGYMASGIVERTAGDCGDLRPGDHVVSLGSRLAPPINSVWGGHSAHRVAAASGIVKIPVGVDGVEAAMFVLPSVGLHAVSLAGIREQDTVLITGQGLIGQFFGQFARLRGAQVIALEPNEARAALARQYVTEHVLNPFDNRIKETIDRLTGGKGPSVVVEATASAGNIAAATRFLRPGGKMVFLSWYPDTITLTFAHFHDHQITAYFPTGAGRQETWRAVLANLASGALKIGANITHRLDYQDACAGYRLLIQGDKSVIGMVFDWRKA